MGKQPKKPAPRRKGQKRKISAGRVTLWLVAAMLLGVLCAIGLYIMIILNGQKLLAENKDKLDMSQTSIIYDSEGKEVTRMYTQNRVLVSLGEVPKLLREAFIATEDRRFESHFGVDLYSIGRALYRDILHRSAVEGASTITQQLAKNMFLSSQKTVFRKVQEASIAIALENQFTKDEILEMYLNRIYFGNSAYGIKAASMYYFGKSDLNQLDLAEMATLAGIPKSPANYSPTDNPEQSKARRATVLTLMADQGYITQAQKEQAMNEELKLNPHPETPKKTEFRTFMDYVMQEASDVYGISDDELYQGGYRIYTTLDVKAQQAMDDAYKNDKLFQADGPDQPMESAMVIYNQHDGGIAAMIGGRNYTAKGWNRALVPRQPGSSFKPIVVYGPALEKGGWTPYSMLKDERMSFNGYSPRNYDNRYPGEVTMMEAVKKSINVPAVWLLNQIGLDYGMKFAENLGITFDKNDRNLAIALGGMTKGASPLQMARAYGAFANNGILNKPHAIVKIEDSQGRTIASFKPEQKRVMSPQTSYYMTKLLESVVEPGGTGASARMDRPVAGKTGSTQLDLKGLEQYYRDLWFVGYTTEYTAAVWMGFDKTDSRNYVKISSGAPAALFKTVMSRALAGKPATDFERPQGVKEPAPPPRGITDLKAVFNKDNHAVELSWSPYGSNSTYKLYRKESKEAGFGEIMQAPDSRIIDMSVQAGATYQYYVTAVSADGDVSDKSNIAEVSVPADDTSGIGIPGIGQPGGGPPQNGQNGGQGSRNPADASTGNGNPAGGSQSGGSSRIGTPPGQKDGTADGGTGTDAGIPAPATGSGPGDAGGGSTSGSPGTAVPDTGAAGEITGGGTPGSDTSADNPSDSRIPAGRRAR
jgi:penicillin-binding protein 2A